MTEDLVKRLREHVIHLDAWGKEAIPIEMARTALGELK